MAIGMLIISTVAYCDIFRVLYTRIVRPVDDVNRAQSVLLVCWCTVTWTAFGALREQEEPGQGWAAVGSD